MSRKVDKHAQDYFFIDVDLRSRVLIGWGSEPKDEVEVHLTKGYHRVFLAKGQFNKLARKLSEFCKG